MLANNNQQVITRMARRSLKSNKRRNAIIICAVILAAFMLFTVLSVGVTYFNMYRLQNIRINGAEFDAVMYGLTEQQQKSCEENPDIIETGIAAIAGYPIETSEDSTINAGLIWADDTYWNTMMEPAREWVKGSYPQEQNEIMVTQEALKECGMEKLDVGDSFIMKYGDDLGIHTKEFKISGIWDGYGPKRVFYMSKAFYEQSGKELSNVNSGRYFIRFKQRLITQKKQDEFINSMNMGKQQQVIFAAQAARSVEILTGMVGIILITCFCAYLLIYNIMYLSISGNVRYYGLLQTIGMTERQIYRLIVKQVLLLGTIGVSLGMLMAIGMSLFIIPEIIKVLGISGDEIQVAFHPVIFFLTVVLSGATVYMGSRKPAQKAVSISPIEATGYRPIQAKKAAKRTGRGRILWKLAKEQLTRDKKKTIIVVLSLAASLSVFLCLITLVEGQRAEKVVSSYRDVDLILRNDTLRKEDRSEWKELLDQEFQKRLTDVTGVKEVSSILSADITVPWEAEFADIWMKEFYAKWMSESYEDAVSEYKKYPENFGAVLIGISENDFERLNATLEYPIDKEDFLQGRTCILYRNGLEFETSDLAGKRLICAEYLDKENTHTFEIAGLSDDPYYTGGRQGFPPTTIVSDTVLKKFFSQALVYKAGIFYTEEYNEDTERYMLELIKTNAHEKDLSYDSKLEEMNTFKSAQGNMMEVGIGIVLVLALIGILNYINTVTGNIQSRHVELAVIESIGMTEKQLNEMLMLEGAMFAGCSLILTATFGTAITYAIYQSVNYYEIAFTIPFLPMVGMIVFITGICVMVPRIARFMLVKKQSIIERIRGVE